MRKSTGQKVTSLRVNVGYCKVTQGQFEVTNGQVSQDNFLVTCDLGSCEGGVPGRLAGSALAGWSWWTERA